MTAAAGGVAFLDGIAVVDADGEHGQVEPEADGSVRIVIADGDPGHPNWLDTCGHRVGILFFRWLHADPEVLPTCTVVPG